MSIVTTEEYFEDRIAKLVETLNSKNKKYEHNRIEMAELGNKIKEFETAYDEGFEMFSPIVATDASFNAQEVKNLKMKIYLLLEDNNLLDAQMTEIKEELNILRNFYNEKKKTESESNTLTLQSDNILKQNNSPNLSLQSSLYSGVSYDEIIDSLKRCIDYCDMDIQRVKIELNNLLDKLKKD